ncbi:MFS transporter [Actinospica robiniae]|uniref:MFS transporter n=1 Tax=Actinospica robiniae TaxID=304901 RepID=UPI00041C4595|nr:MFS transporter [Actinospica robiniae]
MSTQVSDKNAIRRRVFALPGFRRYYLGSTASMFGTAMAGTATSFAVLDTGRGASSLGLVMACGIAPLLLCLPLAGVLADRFGARRVMLTADALRCANRAALALCLVAVPRLPLGLFVLFSVVEYVGDGLFLPSYSALIRRLVDDEMLQPANALLSVANSTFAVIGPAIAGVLVAAFGPPLVLGLDSASFAVCFLALLGIPFAAPAAARSTLRPLADLREGWAVFAGHPWLWLSTLQFALFNFAVWAPYLVLGPTLSRLQYGGARTWGVALGSWGLGAVAGGLAMVRLRKTRRSLILGIAGTAGYALAPAGFALGLSLPLIAVLLAIGGGATQISGVLYTTVKQQLLPVDALARVDSYTYLGAFALGPLGLLVAGPVGGAVGDRAVLGFSAVFQLLCTGFLLALPAGRRLPAPALGPRVEHSGDDAGEDDRDEAEQVEVTPGVYQRGLRHRHDVQDVG